MLNNNYDLDSTLCIVDALEICLACNNSKFSHQNFLQKDGTAQGPHMSCSNANIAMAKYDSLANKFHSGLRVWKRFRDNIFVLWEHDIGSVPLLLSYLNSIDKTGKINFTREIASDTGLEFIDLKLEIVKSKVTVNIFAKPTNNFSYTTPSTCYPKRNISNMPKGIALTL